MKDNLKDKKIPDQCLQCARFDIEAKICRQGQDLCTTKDLNAEACELFVNKELDELRLLTLYVREKEAGREVNDEVSKAVDNVLSGYDRKLQLYILGVARRKVKQMTSMVDLTDMLLEDLTDLDKATISTMTASQKIRLLSELNNSVNKDLSLLMQILQAGDDLEQLQINLTQNNLMVNASSQETNDIADEMLELGGASRDKIRRAFNSILHQIEQEDLEHLPEVEVDYEEVEELDNLYD